MGPCFSVLKEDTQWASREAQQKQSTLVILNYKFRAWARSFNSNKRAWSFHTSKNTSRMTSSNTKDAADLFMYLCVCGKLYVEKLHKAQKATDPVAAYLTKLNDPISTLNCDIMWQLRVYRCQREGDTANLEISLYPLQDCTCFQIRSIINMSPDHGQYIEVKRHRWMIRKPLLPPWKISLWSFYRLRRSNILNLCSTFCIRYD